MENSISLDLFEHYESLPLEVQAVLDKYSELDNTYDNCRAMQDELEGLGYTFDWGLDAVPYDLREMSLSFTAKQRIIGTNDWFNYSSEVFYKSSENILELAEKQAKLSEPNREFKDFRLCK